MHKNILLSVRKQASDGCRVLEMGLFYLFFVSSCRPLEVLQPYTSIREEKLGDMPDVMFIIWNTLHVFLATLYIRIGKRLWALGLK